MHCKYIYIAIMYIISFICTVETSRSFYCLPEINSLNLLPPMQRTSLNNSLIGTFAIEETVKPTRRTARLTKKLMWIPRHRNSTQGKPFGITMKTYIENKCTYNNCVTEKSEALIMLGLNTSVITKK